MKKTITSLVAICAIGVCALAGCEGGGGKGKVGEGFAIANKEALQEEWPINGGTRQITFTCDDEEFNASALISSGDIVVESSNTDVVSVVGSVLYPISVGKATITATYGKHDDSVEISISEFAKVVAPYEVDQQYYLGTQNTRGEWKYVDGGLVDGRDYEGTMTYYLEDAVLVTLEDDDSGEGYYLSFTQNGVKYYIAMYYIGTYMDLQYTTTPTSIYWDADYECFTDADNEVYLGYYETYDCLYACQWKYWGSSEPAVTLIKPDEAVESIPWECPAETATYVTSIAAGTYHLGLYNDYSEDKYGTYYFTGGMSSYYGATSKDVESAVTVTVTASNNNWKLSITETEGSTQYIGLEVSTDSSGSTHYNFVLVSAEDASGATTEFTWNETYYCFTVEVNSSTYFLGTYGSNTTFGWCRYSSISSSHEYPGRLYAIDGGTGDGGNTGVQNP